MNLILEKKGFVKFQKRVFLEEENLVKKTCRELGITQKELAERIGVSRQTVSDWSSGRAKISKTGEKILYLLKIEEEYFELQNVLSKVLNKTNFRYSDSHNG
jgi:transcriptional regulator with XRE-family HTH domain